MYIVYVLLNLFDGIKFYKCKKKKWYFMFYRNRDIKINNFLICYNNYLNCIEKIVFDVMLIN